MSVLEGGKPEAGGSILNDPKTRGYIVQAVLVLLLLVLVYFIFRNTAANLAKLNIGFGYDFLGQSSGFDISQKLIPYSSTSSYGRAILVGFYNTLLVAGIGIVLSTVIGFTAGVMRLSKNWLISRIALVYIETIRNVPLLLQIFMWYALVLKPLPGPKQAITFFNSFFLSNRGLLAPMPIFGDGAWLAGLMLAAAIAAAIAIRVWATRRQEATGQQFPHVIAGLALVVLAPLFGLLLAWLANGIWPISFDYPELKGFNFKGGFTIFPEFMALLTALSIYSGAFIAEIVRAGIQAVSHGQTEASGALGLRGGPTLRLVVIPQALRVIIPPLTSQYLNLTKNSSLGVAIAYPDLVAMGGTVNNQSGRAIEVVFIWMVVYLTLSLVTSALMNWYNASKKLVER
jgi:general L-amino acid transport system permease protein